MNKQLSEKDLENLIKQAVCDASANEKLNEIADSPAMWWGVQRRIADQKARSPWPPANIVRRWLIIGLPAAAAVLFAVSVLLIRSPVPSGSTEIANSYDRDRTPPAAVPPVGPEITTTPEKVEPPVSLPRHENIAANVRRSRARRSIQTKESPAELRSEFIALSYAVSPESGQMVRVKVPRSMMVSLGLVAAVDKPNGLVDADVVIGDDGTTHAIRFVR